jgi:hypothetical protein
LIGSVCALYHGGVLGALPDGQLLERFIAMSRRSDRVGADLAFAALLKRHGPMVWRFAAR